MSDIFDAPEAVEEFKSLMRDPAARQAFVELKAEHASQNVARRYSHILQVVGETPWAILPSMLAVIVDLLAFRAAGGHFSAEEIEQRIGARRAAPPQGQKGVAVIPLHGVIMPKASLMGDVSGGTSIEQFRSMFRDAMAASDVGSIVLDVDSPGGMVDGVPEMAAEIRAARGTKPVVAVANTQAASAAYWLASQASEVVVSKSGRVGSIGVFTAHEDQSAHNANEGVSTTLISAGKYKTEGNPFEPLSADARASLQGMVDNYYGMFVQDVAKGRNVPVSAVRDGYGEGRMLGAGDAMKAGMVERVATTEDVIRGLLQDNQTTAMAGNVTTSTIQLQAGEALIPIDDDLMEAMSEVYHFDAAVDESAWDGGAAMSRAGNSDDPAAAYGAICAGRRNGDPKVQSSWALPHHKNPGDPPNAAGTRNALSRLPQTQGLTNASAAKSHLDKHMAQISPASSADELLRLQTQIAQLSK